MATSPGKVVQELKFVATLEKGEVSALLRRPDGATHLLVLGHGASSNMRTPMLNTVAEALAEQKIATFRYNFPYSEKGGGRNGKDVCVGTIRSAVAAALEAAPDLPLLAGGHSFSGRMTSTGRIGNAARRCSRDRVFLVSASPGGRTGHNPCRASIGGQYADVIPERHA